MPLKPSLVLLMKPPTLILERLSCQILLIAPLLVVEDIEQCVRVDASVKRRVLKDGKRLLGELRV